MVLPRELAAPAKSQGVSIISGVPFKINTPMVLPEFLKDITKTTGNGKTSGYEPVTNQSLGSIYLSAYKNKKVAI